MTKDDLRLFYEGKVCKLVWDSKYVYCGAKSGLELIILRSFWPFQVYAGSFSSNIR